MPYLLLSLIARVNSYSHIRSAQPQRKKHAAMNRTVGYQVAASSRSEREREAAEREIDRCARSLIYPDMISLCWRLLHPSLSHMSSFFLLPTSSIPTPCPLLMSQLVLPPLPSHPTYRIRQYGAAHVHVLFLFVKAAESELRMWQSLTYTTLHQPTLYMHNWTVPAWLDWLIRLTGLTCPCSYFPLSSPLRSKSSALSWLETAQTPFPSSRMSRCS